MKYCTNCGSEISLGNSFCTNCGAKVDAMGSSETTLQTIKKPRRINGDALKVHGSQYFNWLVRSIKHPSSLEKEENQYGLVTLVLEILLLPFTIWLGTKWLLIKLIEIWNQVSTQVEIGDKVDIDDIKDVLTVLNSQKIITAILKHEYITIMLVGLVVLAVTIGLAVFAMKQFTAKPLEFRDYANQVGHYSAILVPVEVLLGLYTYFMQSTTGSVLLLLIVLLMMIIGLRALIAPLAAAEFTKFDRIYVLSGMILITLGINLYAVTFILNNLFQYIHRAIQG